MANRIGPVSDDREPESVAARLDGQRRDAPTSCRKPPTRRLTTLSATSARCAGASSAAQVRVERSGSEVGAGALGMGRRRRSVGKRLGVRGSQQGVIEALRPCARASPPGRSRPDASLEAWRRAPGRAQGCPGPLSPSRWFIERELEFSRERRTGARGRPAARTGGRPPEPSSSARRARMRDPAVAPRTSARDPGRLSIARRSAS